MFKRLMASLLSVIMLLGLVPVQYAHADETEPHEHIEECAHNYVQVVIQPEGEESCAVYTCTNCGDTKEESAPVLNPVRVEFSVSPAEAELKVYGSENEELYAEEDGSYSLLPGEYSYVASCEGYESVENVLCVAASGETVTVAVTLEAISAPGSGNSRMLSTEPGDEFFFCEDGHDMYSESGNYSECGGGYNYDVIYRCRNCRGTFEDEAGTKKAIYLDGNGSHVTVSRAGYFDECGGGFNYDVIYDCTICRGIFEDAAGSKYAEWTEGNGQHNLVEEYNEYVPCLGGFNYGVIYRCTICQSVFEDAAGTNNAVWTESNGEHTLVAQDCYYVPCIGGYNYDVVYMCSGCGNSFADEAGTTKATYTKGNGKHKLVKQKGWYTECEGGYNYSELYWCSECYNNFEDAAGTIDAVHTPGTGIHNLKLTESWYTPCEGGYNYDVLYQCVDCYSCYLDAEGTEQAEYTEGNGEHNLYKTSGEYTTCSGGYKYSTIYCCIDCNNCFEDAAGTKPAKYTEGNGKHSLKLTESDYTECGGGFVGTVYICSKCSRIFGDKNGTVVPEYVEGNGKHDYTELFQPGDPAHTCSLVITVEHYWCNVCEAPLADKEGTYITEEQVIFPTTDHKFTSVKFDKIDATETELGRAAITLKQCTICKDYQDSKGEFILAENLEAYREGFLLYAKASSVAVKNADGEDYSGQTVSVDIAELQSVELQAEVLPVTAKSDVTWKSSSTSIATVDANGLVKFLKPGTVTITATAKDGSGKSAKVVFNVSFNGFSDKEKFTAALESESLTFAQNTKIGLQQGDSARINLFSNAKTDALNPELFEFTSSNAGVKVENGIVTAEKAGVSATVTATLKGDPLKRKVSISVKTIVPQLRSVDILPAKEDTAFRGIDANGDLSAESGLEPVSYAIYADKGAAQSFTIKASAIGPDGNVLENTKGLFTWASSATGVATVKENTDGSVVITTKANADGACTISAVSKDASKATGYISVYVMDKTPRLGATSVTLDAQKSNKAELSLVASYGNEIQEVQFNNEKIAVEYDAENELLIFSATELMKNQTIKGQLLVKTEAQDYPLNLNVVIKNTAPSVTIKQPQKFNLFYLDSSAELQFTVKNETITNVELAEGDFVGQWDGEKLMVSAAAELPAKPNTKLTVKLWLDGYEYPVEKVITLATVNTKPNLKLNPASVTINTALGEDSVAVQVYDNAAKANYDLSEVEVIKAYNGTVELPAYIADDSIFLDLSNGFKAGKQNVEIKGNNWTKSVVLSFNLAANTAVPVLKPAATSLTVNSQLPNAIASTVCSLSLLNAPLTSIEETELTCVKPSAESEKLRVWFEDGKINADVLDSSIKNGSYSYSFKPVYNYGDESIPLKEVKLTVKVVNTLPKLKLSATTVNLNSAAGVAGMELASVMLSSATAGYSVVGVSCEQADTSASMLAESAKIIASENDDSVDFSLDSSNLPKAGTYKYKLVATIAFNESGDTVTVSGNVSVKVYNNAKYSATVSASGKLDAVVADSAITYTLTKLTNVVGNVADVELAGADAELFELEYCEANAKGQYVVKLKMKEGVEYSTKQTYKLQLKYILEGGIEVMSNALSVKVSSSAIKLKANPASQNFYQSQSKTRVVRYEVQLTGPAGAKIGEVKIGNVGLLQRSLVNEDTNISVNVAGDGSKAVVYVTLKDTSALVANKTYTLPLEVMAAGQASGTAAAKINLTLKMLK